jgi:uncharacterized protein
MSDQNSLTHPSPVQPQRITNVPVQPNQRIHVIDILRGFAIFGILLVNMEFFNNSVFAYAIGLNKSETAIDQLSRWFIAFFGEGKFYSIFAFLFGLGMAIQFNRTQEKGTRFVSFFLKRMLVLLLIGLIHAYLFWVGDILILYSVLGIVLAFLFTKCRSRTLAIWTLIFLIVPILINAALYGLVELSDEKMMVELFSEQERVMQTSAENANQIYAAGDYLDITRQRIADMNFVFSTWPFMGFNVLAMVTLGLAVGKKRIFDNLRDNLTLIRKTLAVSLTVGVTGNLLYVIAGESAHRFIPSLPLIASLLGQTFGAPALALSYVSGLILLTQRPSWQMRLAPLASVGRMAITNYLLQTVICTSLFYGYGFGLYGTIGAAAGILLTVLIYAMQIPMSNWWLKRFRFGPVEWLWRTLTYGQRQPMRLA